MYTHKLLVSQEAEQIGETCKKVPFGYTIYTTTHSIQRKKGRRIKILRIYMVKILKDLKRTVWKINEFCLYNKCEKIKNVIKFRFCLKNTDKNTRELGIKLI